MNDYTKSSSPYAKELRKIEEMVVELEEETGADKAPIQHMRSLKERLSVILEYHRHAILDAQGSVDQAEEDENLTLRGLIEVRGRCAGVQILLSKLVYGLDSIVVAPFQLLIEELGRIAKPEVKDEG